MSLNKELDGLMVVSLEQAVAAPYCGTLLADAGARVIKVERPEGDFARGYDAGANGQSAIFAWLNRGKESIALNLKMLMYFCQTSHQVQLIAWGLQAQSCGGIIPA